MEITNMPATGLPAKMSLTIFGIPEKNSGTCVTPMPMAKLVRTAAEKKSLLGDAAGGYEYKTAARLSALTETASEDAAKLSDALLQAGELPSAQEAADFYQAEVFKDMAELRLAVDEMETLTSRACWPYPTYGELLFSVR